MSQEKVDKRKYEKQHRKEIEKKNKIKRNVSVVAIIVVLLAIIATPFGYSIYKSNQKDKESQALYQDFLEQLATYSATDTEDASEDDSDTEDTSEDNTDTTDAE